MANYQSKLFICQHNVRCTISIPTESVSHSYLFLEVPGPIDNNKICITRCGQSALRINSDYVQLSEEQWNFLYEIYGGGPDIMIRQHRPPSPNLTARKADEVSMKMSEVKA